MYDSAINRELVEGIRKELGDGWTASIPADSMRGAQLQGPKGQQLNLLFGWEGAGKMKVQGLYDIPHNFPGTFARLSIGVSASRSAASIARDIERRLLPGYETELLKVADAKTRHEADRAARKELADRLVVLMRGSSSPGRDSQRTEVRMGHPLKESGSSQFGKYITAELRLDHDGSFSELNIRNVPAAALIQIAEILGQL